MAYEVVARAESERGELVVRRRRSGGPGERGGDSGDVLELRVNGVFVTDTAEATAERLLARATLRRVGDPRRVLVGGLGLAHTVRELLADSGVDRVVVVEIERAVVDWMRQGVLPGADVLDDPRLQVIVGDVRQVVRDQPAGSYDVVLLDVDNGPDFLVYDANATLYEAAFLTECRRLLDDAGALAVWSSTFSGDLETALLEAVGGCDVVPVHVDLQGRDERYWIFTSTMMR